ncbi:hypothetical protein K2173_017574 [Erythroxylum novogranatense]|uniref:Thioredoxin domain-containing protein n=1 Tax=Erythroxylum novogranatense TaxID=1862640 RepID=A0AAV8T8X4_9ROSI|nr:hypothetical protein K2173_017574 [Erythroxylum novogranatense]
MADVLIKTNLVSFSSSSQSGCYRTPQQNSFYVVSRSNRLKGFPLKVKSQALRSRSTSMHGEFHGKKVVVQGRPRKVSSSQASIKAQALRLGSAQKWWEKGLQPNMKEVNSAQDLVDSLLNAGDKLVVVDFFSPGCGGCKALHPKVCQLAEMNPDVLFLHVNYEEHKSMCYSLNVHVLPFFRFYRGAQGRLCSFSCTNATIKKFKDALAKHSPDRCSLGPPKGLEEKELLALAANRDLSFAYAPKPAQTDLTPTQEEIVPSTVPSDASPSMPLRFPSAALNAAQDSEERNLVTSGRS